jgi:hypothetical protein
MLTIIAAMITLSVTVELHAASFTIDDANDLFLGVGDYAAVAGYDGTSPPVDQQLTVLSADKKNQAIPQSNSVDMGDLWSTLSAGGVTTTSTLVFGLIVNEQGSTPAIDIQQLSMTFQRVGGGADAFFLSPDQLTVVEYAGGNNTDARIQVNLGFDFMAEYTASSTQQFTISATIDNMSAGDDIFFLSSGFTAAPPAPEEPIPEPGTLALFSALLLTAALVRRKRKGKGKRARPANGSHDDDGQTRAPARTT